MTKAEYIERYGIDKYNEHNEIVKLRNKERYKNELEYREYQKDYHKDRYINDSLFRDQLIEYQKEYQKDRYTNNPEYREYKKEYKRNDLNSTGKTKDNIRRQSRYILFDKRHHIRLKRYEIHHCFGYEDPSKFIYIPRSLHIKIHQYLRDNNIDADSNHYDYIKYMINECDEYTYISI